MAIGKGHYVGRQADYETITYIGRQRRLQVYPHVHVSAEGAIV